MGRWLRRTTTVAEAAIRHEAPRSHPTPTTPPGHTHMADGITSTVLTAPLRGVVRIPSPCVYVVRGTRPHMIYPRRAKRLRFYWDKKGRIVYAKQVSHPGTAPNPFTIRGLHRALRGMLR